MYMETNIRLDNSVKKKLDSIKIHPRESYSDVIARMLDSSPKTDNFDEESLKETIEVLSDPEAMRNIADALEEINKGNYGVSLDEIEKELKL